MTNNYIADNAKPGLNREAFKLLLMALMVLDHIGFFISPYLADVFHIITRVVAVGFGYLLVEGMHYTHSRRQYILRLFGWSAFMSLGNFLMNQFILTPSNHLAILGDNIFLTLALGAAVVALWDNQATTIKNQRLLKVSAVILGILSLFPIIEGSFLVIPFIFITQLTYQNPKRRNLWYVLLAFGMAALEVPLALSAAVDFTPALIFDTIAVNASEPFFLLIIPLLHFYNGQIGKYSHQLKYVFYIFYPAHLWLIHLLQMAVS